MAATARLATDAQQQAWPQTSRQEDRTPAHTRDQQRLQAVAALAGFATR